MPQHPVSFEAYPGERLIEVIKAWITHPWPMTPVQAKELYESLGYRVYAPKPRLFFSEFAQEEPDSFFTAQHNQVGNVRISVSRPCTTRTQQNENRISHVFTEYCAIIDSSLRDSISQRKTEESSIRWTLDNDIEIRLAKLPRNISLRIASPRMTQLLREEREMGLTSYDDILEDD